MGGSVFASGDQPLLTPRMPKDVYEAFKKDCHEKLQHLYKHVASPLEGPGKPDYGDIDVLLALPINPFISDDESFSVISQVLGAKRLIINKDKTAHFALPWPSKPSHQVISQLPTYIGGDEAPDLYAQVDIRLCDSLQRLKWMAFKHGHGDVWNILGSTMRPYGLTVDDTALWLRIPEIEKADRKRAKILLTTEPVEVLQFLGLPVANFWDQPFEDIPAMFRYIAQCRMLHVRQTTAEEEAEDLKHKDRAKLRKRQAYRTWLDEFIPQCRAEGRFAEAQTTRDEIRTEAFNVFGVEKEYMQRRLDFLLERQRDHIWNNVIKLQVPIEDPSDPKSIQYRSCLVKALKKIILEGHESFGISIEKDCRDDTGFFIEDKVIDFIVKNQDQIGKAAMNMRSSTIAEVMLKKEMLKKENKDSAMRG